jgi:hypothetical protein
MENLPPPSPGNTPWNEGNMPQNNQQPTGFEGSVPQHMPPPKPHSGWAQDKETDTSYSTILGLVWEKGRRVLKTTWLIMTLAWVPTALFLAFLAYYIFNHKAIQPLRAVEGASGESNDIELSICGQPGCFEDVFQQMQANGLKGLIITTIFLTIALFFLYIATLSFITVVSARATRDAGQSASELLKISIRRTPHALFASILVYFVPFLLTILLGVALFVIQQFLVLALLPVLGVLFWWFGRASLVSVSVGLDDSGLGGIKKALITSKSNWWLIMLRLFVVSSLVVGVVAFLNGFITAFSAISPILAGVAFIIVRSLTTMITSLTNTITLTELYTRLSKKQGQF